MRRVATVAYPAYLATTRFSCRSISAYRRVSRQQVACLGAVSTPSRLMASTTNGGHGAVRAAPTDDESVELFKRYLRLKTVSSREDYGDAVALLKEWADGQGLPMEVLELVKNNPIVLIKWEGTEPSLPTIVLNSHMDVVPAEEDKWTVDPWAAEEIDGRIYGRGTQDMKCVGIQYLLAVQRLMARGFKPRRTVYLLFVPDEEAGGVKGMQPFAEHPKVAELNAGVVLDEGLASTTDSYKVFWGERKCWWVRVRTTGPAGHGSRFVEDTAVEKLMRVANKLLEFRQAQYEELKAGCGCGKELGDVTTVNMTSLKAGVKGVGGVDAYNVIPTAAEAGFDIRISATRNLEEFKALLDMWTEGEGIHYDLVRGTEIDPLNNATTELTADNEWWTAFEGACKDLGMPLDTAIFPAATDSRFLRMLNIPAFGFSPIKNTPILLHDHDEFIYRDGFLEGIGAYEGLIPALTDAKLTPARDVGYSPDIVAHGLKAAGAAGGAGGANGEAKAEKRKRADGDSGRSAKPRAA